jgi:hypothetical protein
MSAVKDAHNCPDDFVIALESPPNNGQNTFGIRLEMLVQCYQLTIIDHILGSKHECSTATPSMDQQLPFLAHTNFVKRSKGDSKIHFY